MAKVVHSKRNYFVSALIVLLGLLFLLTMMGLNLINPLETQAHPQYGFTPQPPPTTPRPTPSGNDSNQDEDEDDSDQPPTHRVTIQIDGCDLSCSTGAALASSQNKGLLAQTAGPGSYTSVSAEMLAHVKLIHEGSGWIAEGTISDAKPVSFAVPYPGQWQVFLIDEPEFSTGEALDLSGTDIEALQASLSQAPVLLGVVEANGAQLQWINCPLNCPTVNFTPPPPIMPESGAPGVPMPLLPFIGSGILWLFAFFAHKVYQRSSDGLKQQPQNNQALKSE